jgi:glucosamine-6-phosphate deaminase
MEKEKEVELVDLDEKGNNKEDEKPEKKIKKRNLKSFAFISLMIILILGILFINYYFKRKNKIELIIANDYEEMSKLAAEIFSDLIKKNPNSNLGLATGSTPLGLYNELIKKNKNKEITFKNISTYNLDEYCGIPQNHSQSYYSFMKNHLFNYIDINLNNTHIPKGEGDIEKNVKNYEEGLNKNKINLQLLGVGRNGHIGFNEPGTNFKIGVHEVDLEGKTIQDNARFFKNDINKVPKKAITMGIKNILDADTIILIANGTKKADAVKYVMSGIVDENIPVSALNTHKGKVYVIVDKDAASKL